MYSLHDVLHGMVCLLPAVCVSSGESVLGLSLDLFISFGMGWVGEKLCQNQSKTEALKSLGRQMSKV